MALSKKHYEQFAYRFAQRLDALDDAALYPHNTAPENDAFNTAARKMARDQLQNLAAALAADFAADNPRFDRARFMKACGF